MEKIASLEEFLGILPSYLFYEDNLIIENESLCPCGKGEKYKECCFNKHVEICRIYSSSEQKFLEKNTIIENYLNSRTVKNIPSFKLYKKSLEKKNVAFCLASNSNIPCSNERIRYAHTLAESSVLKVLSENQKNLYTFNRYLNFPSDSLEDYFVSITTKEASIVNTFCDKHDKKLFKEIENGNIYKSEPLQELQLALNAAALRVYGLILQIMLQQKMLGELDELWFEQRLHITYAIYIEEFKKSIVVSNKLVSDIENSHTSDLFAFSLELKDKKLPFVLCECFDIDNDILAFINVFPSEGGTWITVSTYEEGKAFIELLRNYKNEKKINEILQIVVDNIASQGSNIYFKENYIKSLTEEEKAILYYEFTKSGAERIAESLEEEYFSNYSNKAKRDLYFNTLILK